MRILYISTQYPVGEYNRNGMYIYQTAKGLTKKFEVIVLALHPVIPPVLTMIKNFSNFTTIYKEWKNKFPKKPRPPNGLKDINVIYTKFYRLPRPFFQFSEAWGSYISTRLNANKLINKNTIIHANWIFPESHLAYLLSKKFKVPFIITLRGSEFNHLNGKDINSKYAKKIIDAASKVTAVTKDLFRKAERIGITVSEGKFILLNDFYDFNKFTILNKGDEQKKLGISNDENNILFPGALRKIKNIYSLLKSIIKLNQRANKSFHLYIAGYGYEENNLREYIYKNNINKYVTFLGNVTADKLVSYYNACDLICLPSFSEGFPTVIVEALSCGTPVVASHVGGIPDIIKNSINGFLIDPNSVDSLTSAIKMCTSINWDREKLRDSISYLSTKVQLEKYSELYAQVFNTNKQ